jgi:hypothetical protein
MGTCGSSLTDVVRRTAKRVLPTGRLCARGNEIFIPDNVVHLVSVHIRSRPTASSSKNVYNLNELLTWSCPNTFLRYLRSHPVNVLFTRITRFKFGVKCFVALDSVRK